MTEAQRLAAKTEHRRVMKIVENAVAEIRDEGGDIDWFAAFLMRAGIELQMELNGRQELERLLSSMATDVLASESNAGRA